MKKRIKSPISRGYNTLMSKEKLAIPSVILHGVLKSLKPYVYVLMASELLRILSMGGDVNLLIVVALVGIGINLLLTLLCRIFEQLEDANLEIMFMYEQNTISKKLIEIDFETLKNPTFASKVYQHFDEGRRGGGINYHLFRFASSLTTSITGIFTALFLTRKFWSVVLFSTEGSFLQGPWLLVVIAISTAATGGIAAAISGLCNKKSSALRDKYADINRVHEYYRTLVTDYKTGKEIRLYKQQDLIMEQAALPLLNDGVRLQRRISNQGAFGNGVATLIPTEQTPFQSPSRKI